MTTQRVEAIYARLGELTIQLDMQVERGPTYLMDKLLECRRLQDETVSLLNETRRARATVKVDRRAQQAILALQPTDLPTRQAVRERDDEYDTLTALEQCVNTVRRNLSQTDSDIRLGAKLVEQAMKMGPVKPSAANAAMQDVIPDPMPEPPMGGVTPVNLPGMASEDVMPFTAPPDPPVPEVDLGSLIASDPVRPGNPGAAMSSIADIDKFLSGE